MDLNGKKIAVLGAAGSIGRAICEKLAESGAEVFAVVKTGGKGAYLNNLASVGTVKLFWPANVTNIGELNDCVSDIHNDYGNIDGFVYAVGHCPPHGFEEEIGTPLSALAGERFTAELGMHVSGLLNVFQAFSPILLHGSGIVVVSSAITRITDKTCPPWLHAGHYAAAVAANAELVRWMRRDHTVKVSEINIYRLAFGAIDTPFHEGNEHHPPAMLSLDEVTQKIISALQGEGELDQTIVATPPTQ